MWGQFNKLKQRQQGQLFLPFEYDDDGYTIEPKKTNQESKYKIGPFLSKALNYNTTYNDQEPTD